MTDESTSLQIFCPRQKFESRRGRFDYPSTARFARPFSVIGSVVTFKLPPTHIVLAARVADSHAVLRADEAAGAVTLRACRVCIDGRVGVGIGGSGCVAVGRNEVHRIGALTAGYV